MNKLRCFFQSAVWVPLALGGAVLLLARCVGNEKTTETAPVQTDYVGAAACAGCHADVYKSHLQTAHFRSSAPASSQTILGSFAPDSNAYAYNERLTVTMEQREGGFFQVAYLRGQELLAKKMDIVVGSGEMGQSFLSWRGRELYQLPITYFSAAHAWSNSPGFPPKAVFNRVITSRCMECHTTYAQVTAAAAGRPEQFDQKRILFGVSCEKCHGPAAAHVNFHQQHPEAKEAQNITNPAKLGRQAQLDACALCHGGRLEKTQPSFSFTPGKSLSDFFHVDTTAPDPASIDVHGNQYGLLRASKCFLASNTFTCNSCHNTHQAERGNRQLFSQRCMDCHQKDGAHFCRFKGLPPEKLAANCVDCHMPLQPSRAIAVFLPGKSMPTAASIRSHYISVHLDATQKYMRSISTGGQ